MRIAFCHHYAISFGGGGERFIADAARWLAQRGHMVDIHCVPIRRGIWHPELGGAAYREGLFHFPDADVSYYIYNPFVVNLFRYAGPKVAGIHSPLLSKGLSQAGYATDNFFGNTRRHGILAALMKSYGQIFQKRELAGFDAIHCVSPLKAEIDHQNIFYIPNWVDTERFSRGEKADDFRIVFVGRHDYAKGFDRYVQVSEILRDFKFFCTGSSVGRIQGVGYLPDKDLANLYSQSSVMVYPTRGDTFGLAILESLACGTPVITTSIPAHASLHLPVLYADTPEAIASTLKKIYDLWIHQGEYEKLVDGGIEAVKRYEISTVLPRFEMMLKSLVGL